MHGVRTCNQVDTGDLLEDLVDIAEDDTMEDSLVTLSEEIPEAILRKLKD